MTADDFIECVLESFNVQRSVVMNRHRFVVKGKFRRELRMEPYLFLREGKRNLAAGRSARHAKFGVRPGVNICPEILFNQRALCGGYWSRFAAHVQWLSNVTCSAFNPRSPRL